MTDTNQESCRKEVFLRLVKVQDEGVSVAESRQRIAQEFNIKADDVVNIEREGLKANWPPL